MRRGTRVGQAYIALTADGSGINDDIEDSMDDVDFDSLGDEHGREYGNNFGSGFEDTMRGIRDRTAERFRESLTGAGDDAGRETASTFGSHFDNFMRDLGNGAFSRDRAHALGDDFGAALSESLGDRLELTLANFLDSADEDIRQRGTSSNRSQNNSSSRDLSDRIGGLFGAGSRNNFLNLVGKTLGNVVGLVSKAQSAATGLFSTFQTGFQSAADGASTLTRVGSGTISVITEIGTTAAVSLPLVAVGALVAIAAMSVLVSVASALLAIVVALASTIASALVGAALVGAGALGALGVAAGLAAVAFTSLTTEQSKALKADFAPLKAELTGLGQLMVTDLIPHFATWAGNLQAALYQLAPLASVFGDALGQAGDTLTASLAGPGFALLTQQLGIYLPGIITRLSTALGGFLNGIAAVFAILLPSVSRFATYLVDVGNRFSNFANSASGQNKIADFIDRAIDSLISFSGFVREATGFVADLLFNTNSQTAGNTIFDSLRDSFAGFREDLKGDDLKHWFERALEFGSDVKDLIISIKDTIKKLDSDGTLEAVGASFQELADILDTVTDVASGTVEVFETLYNLIFHPDQVASSLFDKIRDELGGVNSDLDGVIGKVNLISAGAFGDIAKQAQSFTPGYQYDSPIGPGLGSTASTPSQQGLIDAGQSALDQTYESNGGTVPDPVKKTPKYVNPYVAYANQIIKSGPTAAQAMLTALKKMNGAVADALKASSSASGADAVKSALDSQIDSMRNAGRSGVDAARSSLNSAAESLASAASAKAAKAALLNVKQSKAELKAAKAQQAKINASAAIVQAQKVVNAGNVAALVAGLGAQNATLADYAEARVIVADRLTTANQKLADAISLRDSYNQSVIDGVKAFGSILTAQAQTINGVTQALTATDITTNLQDRLDKIRKFQADLNILLAQGLSNDAYKQLVDAGVETGGAYATALVQGGQGAVSGVNLLTQQISDVATSLGGQASNRLYQAGVDAAQGLVDGLTSLSAQLDSAAAALGNSIAAAVKRALGIASPSKVMKGVTRNVGQTLIDGLSDEETAVERAANALGSRITIQPSAEVAHYASEQAANAGVSENQAGTNTEHHYHIETPTTDPEAVAREMMNEITGRIG